MQSKKLNNKKLSLVGCEGCGAAGENGYSALRYSELDINKIAKIFPEVSNFSPDVVRQIGIEGKYQGYLKRQELDILSYKRDQDLKIPSNIDYDKIGGLNLELRAKLKKASPATLASAGRIPGMTPAGLTALLKYVKK